MTRNLMGIALMGIAAAMALLGSGYGRPIAQAADDWDDESRLKRKALDAACKREREAMREAADKQVQDRARRQAEESARKKEDFNKLRAGIDPTNDRPLSRQQRRALTRRNFPFFASVDTHPKDGDVQQAPLVSGAVAKPDAND